jgi:hypothetical protein
VKLSEHVLAKCEKNESREDIINKIRKSEQYSSELEGIPEKKHQGCPGTSAQQQPLFTH